MQAGLHYIDVLAPDEGGLVLHLVAYFKLSSPNQEEEERPLLVRATVRVDVEGEEVELRISKPFPSTRDTMLVIQHIERKLSPSSPSS
eukprot:760519-Hanusia_phi.AAC.2